MGMTRNKDRRTNKSEALDKLTERMQKVEGEQPPADLSEDRNTDESGIVAVTDQQRSEVNDLFDVIVDAGYMPAGSYSVNIDGDRAAVTLNVILPSSPGTPGNPTMEVDDGSR